MRLLYLKLSLLVGVLAANIPVDSARLLVAHSFTSKHDDVPVPRAFRTLTLVRGDDEERSPFAFANFAADILKSNKSITELIGNNHIQAVVRLVDKKASASEILSDEELFHVSGDLLANKTWVKWAYFVYVTKSSPECSGYTAIIDAMLAACGYELLTDKLLVAATFPNSEGFANALIQELIDQRFQRNFHPYILLKLLRIDLKTDNLFECEQFEMFFDYMDKQFGQQYATYPFIVELKIFSHCFTFADFLKMLTSPSNAENYRSLEYLKLLKNALLYENVLPSDLVYLLALDEAQGHLSFNLQANRLLAEFLLDYYKQFIHKNQRY